MKLLEGTVIAVGGKGGVGKSFFAANIACSLAKSRMSDAPQMSWSSGSMVGNRTSEKVRTFFLR